MPTTLVNPMNETTPEAARPPARLAALEGRTIALLDISKPGGSAFLDRIEMHLKHRGASKIIRAMKPTFAKPAPASVIESIRSAAAVIEALAD